ncbi:MAG: J domain-containing protein [Acidimicrobiales bacterium]
MARLSWRRGRGDTDAPGAVAARSGVGELDDGCDDLLGDLDALLGCAADDPAERYAAWVERLRSKREQAKRITATGGDDRRAAPSYWDPAHVYRESERIEEELALTSPCTSALRNAYAALGLSTDATPEQIEARYRQLAKLHHPDRHRHEPEDVQAFHAEQFRLVCNARKLLQQAR